MQRSQSLRRCALVENARGLGLRKVAEITIRLFRWDNVQREAGQCREVLGYYLDVCRHRGIQLGGGWRVDGDIHTEVLDPFRMLQWNMLMETNLIELGREVKLLSGVKNWERFGTDYFACPD